MPGPFLTTRGSPGCPGRGTGGAAGTLQPGPVWQTKGQVRTGPCCLLLCPFCQAGWDSPSLHTHTCSLSTQHPQGREGQPLCGGKEFYRSSPRRSQKISPNDAAAASPAPASSFSIHLLSPLSLQSPRLPLARGCSSSSLTRKTRTFTSCKLSFGSTCKFPETW